MRNDPNRFPVLEPFFNLCLAFLLLGAITLAVYWMGLLGFLLSYRGFTLAFESFFYLACTYWFFNFDLSHFKELFVWPAGRKRELVVRWLIDILLLFLARNTLQYLLNFDDQNALGMSGSFDSLFILVSIVILVPFGEETLFRGYFQSRLAQIMKPMKAIAITAFVFAMMHSGIFSDLVVLVWSFFGQQQGVLGLQELFAPSFSYILLNCFKALMVHGVSGFYFGYLAWRFQSLWPAIISHGICNLLGLSPFHYTTIKDFFVTHLGMRDTPLFPYIVLIISVGFFAKRLIADRKRH